MGFQKITPFMLPVALVLLGLWWLKSRKNNDDASQAPEEEPPTALSSSGRPPTEEYGPTAVFSSGRPPTEEYGPITLSSSDRSSTEGYGPITLFSSDSPPSEEVGPIALFSSGRPPTEEYGPITLSSLDRSSTEGYGPITLFSSDSPPSEEVGPIALFSSGRPPTEEYGPITLSSAGSLPSEEDGPIALSSAGSLPSEDNGSTTVSSSTESNTTEDDSPSVSRCGCKGQQDRRPGLKSFQCVAVLGRGGFGKVLLAELRDTGQKFAIKALKKAGSKVQSILKEKTILQTVSRAQHPFLVHFFASFHTRDRAFFVLDFAAGGDLSFKSNGDRFPEPRAVFTLACVVLGVQFLHCRKIAHRDLKLQNLLMDSRGYIKITDFGLCKEGMGFRDRTWTLCGTPAFYAPEMLKKLPYTRSVDWWALGVLGFQMMVGQRPFTGKCRKQLFRHIIHQEVKYPAFLSAEAVSLLRKLLSKDPRRRLGNCKRDAEVVKLQPFFRDVDWRALRAQTVPAPVLPPVRAPEVSQTLAADILTRIPKRRVVTAREQELFKDFDYMADFC